MPCLTRHDTTRHDTTRHGYFYQFILDWLNSEGFFIFWLLILGITASQTTYSFMFRSLYDFKTEFLILACDIAVIFINAVLLDFIIYCLLKKTKTFLRIIKFVFLLVSICMFLADLFTIYYWKLPLNSIMLDFVMMTNIRETGEFLSVYLFNAYLWFFFLAVSVVLFILWRVFLFIYRQKRLFVILVICGFILGIFASERVIHKSGGYPRILNSVGLYRISYMLFKDFQGRQEYMKMSEQSSPEIHLTKNESNIPYAIFIVGESTCRNHMSLYGYSLPTSPELTKLKEQGGLYVFDDTVSTHAGTMANLQKIFTFYRYGALGKWFEYTSLFRILHAAGYYVTWISNQESASVGGTSASSFYFRQCDARYFTEAFKESGYNANNYDEMLLPLIDKAMLSVYEKNFYIVHLMGTHFHYHKRYPEKFNKFSYEDEPEGFDGITDSQRTVRANYDNAILYNDFIVREIIRKFEEKNALVIYISDHGEEVYDSLNFFGHYDGLSRNMIEIPMLIWVSSKFSSNYPELEQRIASSIHRPFMTDDMIHVVLDIMGIETEEYDPAKSVINPKFDASRQRIHEGKLYDKENGLHEVQ